MIGRSFDAAQLVRDAMSHFGNSNTLVAWAIIYLALTLSGKDIGEAVTKA